MNFVTQDKLVLIGAAGMIGSNMAQTAAMMHLTPNICLYDPFAKGLEGVWEEMRHCGFEGLNLTSPQTSLRLFGMLSISYPLAVHLVRRV